MTALVLFSLSQAHPKAPPAQKIVFDDDLLTGTIDRPEVEPFYSRRPTKFPNLIKIRENFADKIVKSVDDM